MVDGVAQDTGPHQDGLHRPVEQKPQLVHGQQGSGAGKGDPDPAVLFPQGKDRVGTGKGQRHPGQEGRIDLVPPDLGLAGDPQPPGPQAATPKPQEVRPLAMPSPTATPLPRIKPKDPTTAAIFSTVIPGVGQVYDEDPLRGLIFAGLFGVGLWQTIDNLSLVNGNNGAANGAGANPNDVSHNGNAVVKNEDAGELIGLATLAVYGFGIQDAANGANNYNHRNNLSLTFEVKPRSGAQLALRF